MHDTVLNDIAKQINTQMRRVGKSQLGLALDAGISPNTLYRIFVGSTVKISTLVALAQALGCDLNIRFVPKTGGTTIVSKVK